jgi:hypothetical protein
MRPRQSGTNPIVATRTIVFARMLDAMAVVTAT